MQRFFSRILALALSAAFLFCAVPAGALPALAAAGDTFYIGSLSDLNELSRHCVQDTWSKGMTVYLTTDLDLTDTEFTPIPLFSGTFDGQNHSITGLSVSVSGSRQGLFRQVLAGAVVRSLRLSGSVVPGGSRQYVGGIAGVNYGTIQGCSFSGSAAGTRTVGGIVGFNHAEGVIQRCSVSGLISGEHRTGGIAGENSGLIENCRNLADINTVYQSAISTYDIDNSLAEDELLSLTDAGGIAGYSTGRIEGCTNNGNVGYRNVGYNIGGIVGRQSGRVENCSNTGIVLGRKDVGGILGQMDPDTGWNISASTIGPLQDSLNDLQGAFNALLTELGDTTELVTKTANRALDNVQRAGSAAGQMVKETEQWANANLETINSLSRLVTDVTARMSPIIRQLSGFSRDLTDVSTQLDQALEIVDLLNGLDEVQQAQLQDALTDLRELQPAAEALNESLTNGLDALEQTNNLSSVIGTLKKLMALPAQIFSITGALRNITSVIEFIFKLMGVDSFTQIARLITQLSEMMTDLRSAAEQLADLAEDIGKEPALQFATFETDSEAQGELVDALNDIGTSIQVLQNGTDLNLDSLQDISDKFFALINTSLGLVTRDTDSNSIVYTEDIAALASPNRVSGIVRFCTNYGAVTASTNVGGVAGAITLDLNFDEGSQYSISNLLSQGARYLIYAAVYECSSYAAVRANRSHVGGITGRMDYGAVIHCESSGDISSIGQYVGGIAGMSSGTIHQCRAHASLSGEAYVGGIAGAGIRISECYAIPYLSGYTEFAGAIAGSSETTSFTQLLSQPVEIIGILSDALLSGGTTVSTVSTESGVIVNNYYSGCEIGGVDGFSFTGQTDPLTHEEMLERTDNCALFSSITVTFIAEGQTVAELQLPFGAAIPELPAVPDRDGQYWVWDSFNTDAVYFSCSITGSYHNPLPSLSTGEEYPLFLAQGSFYSGQELTVLPQTPVLTGLNAAADDVIGCYTLSIRDAGQTLQLRYRTSEAAALYLLDESGRYHTAPFRQDGRYIVFSMPNGGTMLCVRGESTMDNLVFWGVAFLTGAVMMLVLLHTRRKRARTKSAQ